jgi:hypothetical protein
MDSSQPAAVLKGKSGICYRTALVVKRGGSRSLARRSGIAPTSLYRQVTWWLETRRQHLAA